MTFYFQPPTGFVSYQKMEMYALNRLKFLLRLNACKDDSEQAEVIIDAQAVQWSDCLIEGTVKDKISHFLLRLTLGISPDTRDFFLKAETTFFRLRLTTFDEFEWYKFLTSLDQAILHQYGKDDSLRGLKYIMENLKDKFGSVHAVAKEFSSLESYPTTIEVPFQFLLNLVATRKVSLKQGMASLPLSMIVDVLAEHFYKILFNVVTQGQRLTETLFVDERVHRLDCVVKRAFMSEAYPSTGIPQKNGAISLTLLKDAMSLFPPCMSEPLRNLQRHHRLHHHDRIQLTLFLKELGLPLHEALLFWKREYSQNTCPSFPGNCTHSWQGNERKYTYSIRHLYGLEGRRVHYRAHSCHTLQEKQTSVSECGQCPFASSDSESLSALITRHRIACSAPFLNKLSHLSRVKEFGKACTCFMLHKFGNFQKRKHLKGSEERLNMFNESKSVDFHSRESSSLANEENASYNVAHSEHGKQVYSTCLNNSESSPQLNCDNFRYSNFKTARSDNNFTCVDKQRPSFLPNRSSCRHAEINTFSCNHKEHEKGTMSTLETKNSALNVDFGEQKLYSSERLQVQGRTNESALVFSRTQLLSKMPKKRKVSEMESFDHMLVGGSSAEESAEESETEISLAKPSHYYWTFKSLLDGLRECEQSV